MTVVGVEEQEVLLGVLHAEEALVGTGIGL